MASATGGVAPGTWANSLAYGIIESNSWKVNDNEPLDEKTNRTFPGAMRTSHGPATDKHRWRR